MTGSIVNTDKMKMCLQAIKFPIILLFSLISLFALGQPPPPGSGHGSGGNSGTGQPELVIQQIVAAPGTLMLGIDALHFNGSVAVSSFSIHIAFDTALIQIAGFSNTNIDGDWSFSIDNNMVQIDFVANGGQSHVLNGSIFDLELFYTGGFQANFGITDETVFYDASQQPIQPVDFADGWVKQITPTGQVFISNEGAVVGQQAEFDVGLQGSGFQQVTDLHLRIAFDADFLAYQSYNPANISDIEVIEFESKIYINWSDQQSPFNAFTYLKAFSIVFDYLQAGETSLIFLPGSYVISNGSYVPVGLNNGQLIELFQLSLDVLPSQAGEVEGAGNYAAGETVNIAASAYDGYYFLYWESSDTVFSTLANHSFVMPEANIGIIARFGLSAYHLQLQANPSHAGTVSGSGVYEAGENVLVSTMPNPGFVFLHWSDGTEILSVDTEYTFIMPENDLLLTAEYESLSYPVSLFSLPENSAQLLGEGDYATGENVAVEAIAESGYTFLHWKEDGQIVSNQALYNFTMPPHERMLTAHLSAEAYLLTLVSDPVDGGQLVGEGNYETGSIVDIEANANPGYAFLHWADDDGILSLENNYSFEMPAFDIEITAVFEAEPFELVLTSNPQNSALLQGAGIYFAGEIVSISAQPAQGYTFVHWAHGAEVVSTEEAYSFEMPAQDLELTAYLELLSFIIEAVPNNPNYGSTAGSGNYYFGETAVLTAMPINDYEFVFWSDGNMVVSYDAIYAFEVYQNRSLTAHFRFPEDCSGPVSLDAEIIDEHSAMLSWLPGGMEAKWDLLWGLTGFDTLHQGQLIEELVFTNYLLEDLSPGTSYDFYVRALCAPDLVSEWAGPVLFTTQFVNLDKQVIQKLILYPNPAKGEVFLVLDPLNKDVDNIHLLEMSGQIFRPSFVKASPEKIIICLHGISNGVYFLILNNNFNKPLKLLVF